MLLQKTKQQQGIGLAKNGKEIKVMFSGRFKNYIAYVVTTCSLVFGGFFDYSTLYLSGSMGTPYVKGNQVLKNDYNYTIGLRKIALFPYQSRSRFYKGNESSLADKAVILSLIHI